MFVKCLKMENDKILILNIYILDILEYSELYSVRYNKIWDLLR